MILVLFFNSKITSLRTFPYYVYSTGTIGLNSAEQTNSHGRLKAAKITNTCLF